MRVCIDGQSAIAQRAGVGRYTRSLIQHLAPAAGTDRLSMFYFDFQRRGVPWEVSGVEHRAVRWCPGRWAQGAWKTVNWPPFNGFAGPADVYHFPNFILPPLTRGKSVVTIHDMSFMRFPEFAEAANLRYLTARIRDTVNRADAIITDSRFSADEIAALLPVDRAKITPIHLGISGDFAAPDRAAADAVRRRHGIDGPYLLSVGTLEPRKNLGFLVDVFERLADFDGQLVLAGMPGWKVEPILQRIRSSPRASRIRHLSYVADEDLPALYAGAELLVVTSLYEGFGFPPLEAMACGTPVVSSAGGSLKEVLGSAAVVLDGYQADPWAMEIRRALSDTALRRRLADDGRTQSQRYRWADTAQKTWDVYRRVGA